MEKLKVCIRQVMRKNLFFQTIQTIFCKIYLEEKKKLSKNGQDQKIINLPKLVCYEKS